MARTLLQIQKQIAELQVIEERLKAKEAAGVAARIKEAIAAYGFTPEALFGDTSAGLTVGQGKKLGAKSSAKPSQRIQFADEAGNKWTGRGPRPAWVRQAVEGGRPLLDFAVSREAKKKAKALDGAASMVDPQVPPPVKNAGGAGKKRAVKYRDGEGNTWSGGGSQPRWLKAALATGKQLEDFLA